MGERQTFEEKVEEIIQAMKIFWKKIQNPHKM